MKKIYLTTVLLCAGTFYAAAQVRPLAGDTAEISYSDSIHISFDE